MVASGRSAAASAVAAAGAAAQGRLQGCEAGRPLTPVCGQKEVAEMRLGTRT